MRAVFYHNQLQKEIAVASRDRLERQMGTPVKTVIVPLCSFTMAEEYHQKYNLKRSRLAAELAGLYPDHQDLVDSTAAARLNGYVSGYGSSEQLEREIDSLGINDENARKILRKKLER